MSGYERAPGVAPVHITSYRARARAARRGWIVQSEDDVDRERFTFGDLRAQRGPNPEQRPLTRDVRQRRRSARNAA